MRPRPTDYALYRRLLRRARVATLLLGLVVAWNVLVMAALLRGGGDTRLAIVPYFGLVLTAVLAWFVVRPLWLASLRARPYVQSLDPTAGEVYGIPELDDAPTPHRGLSGEVPPPTRW
ncbi:MAG: hypothetical protein HGA44_11285 [Cellulomonadaceae bacterium]|nr:hypothetical protein [Cellulomonadaceae bacterium]